MQPMMQTAIGNPNDISLVGEEAYPYYYKAPNGTKVPLKEL
jgi:hypothetical protein